MPDPKSLFQAYLAPLTATVDAAHQADKLPAVLAAAFATVTDYRMWRSAGWLALGLVLFLIGLRMIIGRELGGVIGPIVGAVAGR